MSVSWIPVRDILAWLLPRCMPVTWAWLVFTQQALATLAEGGA
ncbi:hypothetical protein [Wenzhouxiangella limi]|nr:hypothetical protein [Wenzhouxiangella limi]